MIKPLLSKLNFAFGRNPKIEKNNNWRNYIPDPYKTVLLISADFELAWAWQYAKEFKEPLQEAKKMALRERGNIPAILELCDKFKIPVTWATVGHLFLESCQCVNGMSHSGIPHVPNFENDFWKFTGKDWFGNDPGSNYKVAPEWYSPDLIRMILGAKVKHEIGCHTFSHIDCREEICSPDLIRSELRECKKLALELGISLKSFVHPGDTIGNLDVLSEEGFTNFRTNYRNVLGYPKRHKNGLLEFEQTAEFVYRKDWSVVYHISRYIKIIKRAIKNNTLCILWFHPSFDQILIHKILPEVFRFISENNDDIAVLTHDKYVEWLNLNQV